MARLGIGNLRASLEDIDDPKIKKALLEIQDYINRMVVSIDLEPETMIAPSVIQNFNIRPAGVDHSRLSMSLGANLIADPGFERAPLSETWAYEATGGLGEWDRISQHSGEDPRTGYHMARFQQLGSSGSAQLVANWPKAFAGGSNMNPQVFNHIPASLDEVHILTFYAGTRDTSPGAAYVRPVIKYRRRDGTAGTDITGPAITPAAGSGNWTLVTLTATVAYGPTYWIAAGVQIDPGGPSGTTYLFDNFRLVKKDW